MLGTIIQPEIQALIAERNFAALRKIFCEWPPANLAELIQDLEENDRVVIFRLLPRHLVSEVFEYLEIELQEHLLRAMGHEEVAHVLNDMSADDRTALLEELPSNVVTNLLRLLTPEERKRAQTLLNYPEESVGRLMTPDFITVKDDWTVQESLDYIRKNGRDSETLNVIYVVGENDKLIDDVRIREFLLRPLTAKVREIRDEHFIALKVTDPKHDVVEIFKRYDRSSLPVVDSDGVLVGIVTIDDVIDVLEEETTEDIQKLGGVEALDESYRTIPLWRMLGKRAPWLVILFLSEMLTTFVLSHFEDSIERLAVLALFIPLMISSGGNSGSQATTLVIRAMALGEIRLRDWWRVFCKEITAGVLLGAALGVVGFCRITLWQFLDKHLGGRVSFFHADYSGHPFQIAITVGLALIGIVCWGTLVGAMLPFILRFFKLDPATSSAPFVATFVDVTGIFIYFSIAGIIMPSVLHAG